MRAVLSFLLIMGLALGAGPLSAHAAEIDALDRLYDRLAAAKTDSEAEGIERAIERERLRSGSDTADLLMNHALKAMHAEDNALAIELVSAVIRLEPDFTEAWNKRATLLFLEDNYARAMTDIAETLKRDPRHYGAWAGLGVILERSGDKKRAFEAYQRVLAVNPRMTEIRDRFEALRDEVEGRDL